MLASRTSTALLLLAGTSLAEPIVLQPSNRFFDVPKGQRHRLTVSIPAEHRVAGIQTLTFKIVPEGVGLVQSPKIEIEQAGRRFLIPPITRFVFDEPPKEGHYHVQHATLPDRPHLLALRFTYRGKDKDLRLKIARIKFNPAPLGVTCNNKSFVGVGHGIHAATYYLENTSEHPFTLTRSNFENVPKELKFLPIEIPPAR